MASPAKSPSAASSSLPRQLSRKILLLLLSAFVFLQYLNLLQPQESARRRHRGHDSLFTLQWSHPGAQGGEEGRGRRPLLTPLDQYLSERSAKQSVLHAEGGVFQNGDNASSSLLVLDDLDSLQLFPDLVAPSAPVAARANSSSGLPDVNLCPLIPPGLHGPVKVLLPDAGEVPGSMQEIEEALERDLGVRLEPGGRHRPRNCTARHRVAVIVPYRDREEHLRTFLVNIHPFLAKQQIDYQLYVVEQSNTGPFNRAMLMNVGAAEALRHRKSTQCFIFHDVDLLPEDDRNLYTCPSQPRHMSVAINSFLYHLPYDDIFGGVSAMTVDHFRDVNGFSNLFWGWGGEDDDMSNRLRHKRLYISRYPANIARYKMLKHSKDKANPDRFKYLYSGAKRMTKDGYKSLRYRKVDIQFKKLYTWLYVDLPHLKG